MERLYVLNKGYALMKRSHTHIFWHMANCGCTCERMHELATVTAKKNSYVFTSFRPVQMASHHYILPVPFPFHMYMHTIDNNGRGLPKCKMESQLVRLPTRINSFILPLSFKVFWGSALLLLFDLDWVLWLKLDRDRSQLSTIDWPGVANRLRSPPNAIAWTEWCFFWRS